MEKRIDRGNDESLYQPKVHSKRIRALYKLKSVTGIPITVLLDQAIREFTASYGVHVPISENSIIEQASEETWEEICDYRQYLDQLDCQEYLQELAQIGNDI